MADEKRIILAKLDINVEELEKTQEKLKKQFDEVDKKLMDLTNTRRSDGAEIKKLQALHGSLLQQHQNISAALQEKLILNEKYIAVQKNLDAQLQKGNSTENDYLAQNKELIELRRQLNSGSANYVQNISAINEKIAENNKWLEVNGSQHAGLANSMTVYKDKVIESFESINILNGGLSGFSDRAKEAGGVGPLVKGAFDGMAGGIKGMGMAIKANPIGALFTVIQLAVGAVIDIFKQFTPVVNKVEQVMAAVGAVFDSVKNSVLGLLTGATSLSDFFSGFIGSASDAAKEAMNLKEAQQQLTKQTELQEVANVKAKNSIDELMAKVKDQNRTDLERQRFLRQAQDEEKKNFEERKALADNAYNNAVRHLANGKNLTHNELAQLQEKGFAYAKELEERKLITKEELDELKKAEIEREKIYGEEMVLNRKFVNDKKQLNDEIDRHNEQTAAKEAGRRQKLLDDALTKQKQQLALFIAQNSEQSKSLAERLKYEQQHSDKALAIFREELRQKKISQLEYEIAMENLKKDTLRNIAAATKEYGDAQIKLWLEENQSKIKNDTELTASIVKEEKQRLATLRQMQVDKLKEDTKLDENVLQQKRDNNETLKANEMEFLAEMLRLEREHKDNVTSLNATFLKSDEDAKSTEKAKKQQDYDEESAALVLKLENDRIQAGAAFDYDLGMQRDQIEQKRTQELANENLTAEEKRGINLKYDNDRKAAEKAVMDNKLALASSTFGNMAAIMGKESAAGKAMAVAQATIDTYKSAVSAYSSMSGIPIVGPALGAVAAAAAVAAGIANVKKITSTKAPKAEKGALFSIGGRRHSEGGTMFTGADGTQFEAEQGELIGVMNRNAARHFMAFNNAFPAGGASAPNYFAGGGIVSREMATPALNTDELAMKIAEANRALPAPVVAVQDIITEGNTYVQVRDMANF